MYVPLRTLTRLHVLTLLVTLTLLAACGDEPAEPSHDHGTAAGGEAVSARMEDGVQVAEIEAGRMGYAPQSVVLEAGVPARLVFTRTVDSECSSQVQIPDFGVPATDLPMHEPVAIEFTPDEGGEYTFVCGMDMQRGAVVVRS